MNNDRRTGPALSPAQLARRVFEMFRTTKVPKEYQPALEMICGMISDLGFNPACWPHQDGDSGASSTNFESRLVRLDTVPDGHGARDLWDLTAGAGRLGSRVAGGRRGPAGGGWVEG